MDRLFLPILIVLAAGFVYWTMQLGPKPNALITPAMPVSTPSANEGSKPVILDSRQITMGRDGAGPRYYVDFDTALSKGRETHKPLMVVFGADYCGACHHFAETICTSSLIRPYYDRFIWVHVDTQSQSSRDVINRYPGQDFRYIPHVWYVRWDGALIGSHSYVDSPTELASRMDEVLSKVPKAY